MKKALSVFLVTLTGVVLFPAPSLAAGTPTAARTSTAVHLSVEVPAPDPSAPESVPEPSPVPEPPAPTPAPEPPPVPEPPAPPPVPVPPVPAPPVPAPPTPETPAPLPPVAPPAVDTPAPEVPPVSPEVPAPNAPPPPSAPLPPTPPVSVVPPLLAPAPLAEPAPAPPRPGFASPLNLGGAAAPAGTLQVSPRENESAELVAAQAKVAALAVTSAEALTRFDEAGVSLKVTEEKWRTVSRELLAARRLLEVSRLDLERLMAAQYRYGSVDEDINLGMNMTGSSPENFVHSLSLVQLVSHQREDVAVAHQRRTREVAALEQAARLRLLEHQALVDQMEDEKKTAESALVEAEALMSSLEGTGGFAIYALEDLEPFVSTRNVGGALPPSTPLTPMSSWVSGLPPEAETSFASLGVPSALLRAGTLQTPGERALSVAVDPGSYRAFVKPSLAENLLLWQVLARGEVIISHRLAASEGVELGGTLVLTTLSGAQREVIVGAFAPSGLPDVEILVPLSRSDEMELSRREFVVSVGPDRPGFPQELQSRFPGALLQAATSEKASSLAFLSGSSTAQQFGTFSYTYTSDGSVQPDPAWVRANIRSASVPLLGQVTAHRLMLPQLQGAMNQVQEEGLAGEIRSFDGTYVPRFIARDPSRGLSLHTWGIAIDLNASTNYRGIRGDMHPRVVQIFKAWGFRWGGDWKYTDPMHFELGAVLDPASTAP